MSTYFTIDFEDFSHDLGRNLGLKAKVGPRVDALYKSYTEINTLIKRFSDDESSVATFFITGILADQLPDLVGQIARDGHEVACHYYYHDVMRGQNLGDVEYNLKRAIDVLEQCANMEVVGFRAPYFKIDKVGYQQYQLIEKLFKYDSSLCVDSANKIESFYKKMRLERLKILPIYSRRIFSIPMKLGGTFAKIFPKFLLESLYHKNLASDLNEIFYFHPYEFRNGRDWELSFDDLSELKKSQKLYWLFRQKQWLRVGNKKLSTRVSGIMGDQKFRGHLKDLVH